MASTSSSSPQPPPAAAAASPGAASSPEDRRAGGGRGGPPPVPPYVKAAAGSLGGVMEACCLQPIDVVKTRLQLDRTGAYRGIAHCGATVARAEGVRALWKGLTPFATHLTLKYALRLGSNAVLQSAFKDPTTGKVSAHGRLASGFGAGVIEALLIVTPFEARLNISLFLSRSLTILPWLRVNLIMTENEVVKIRLQQQKGLSPDLLRYKGPIHCARTIVREEGLFGLWSGALPTVMRNGTNQAAMFSAKNTFDIVLWKKHEGDGKVLLPWQSMVSGFLAGTAGPVCTGPFDVVKTRLMAQGRTGDAKYKGMVHAIRTIYAEEGLRALWKGLLPRLMRIPPGQAIMWAVADQVMGLYERTHLQPVHI
ncbi:Mitochondrial succinate-fumarate transporter 1 [Zea mays]|uniref:Mitochondrial succinate-fumarate transporter 1 n=2 Tax=Zea mays TaxID=4577 RepID=A0A1D6JZE3_MAIZE|nr:Mitochondrial succinate-fumarate transporter 1 [Zea mays]